MAKLSPNLSLRAEPTEGFFEVVEAEAIELFHAVNAAAIPGVWEPSPVEEKYRKLRELLLTTPGGLRSFRRSLLAAGRLNFPDCPQPKGHHLQWNSRLAGQKRAGALTLLLMAAKLYRHRPFRMDDINDNLVGDPVTYRLPVSANEALKLVVKRLLRLSYRTKPRFYHVTEAALRFFYYRSQIASHIGSTFESVLEVGGGYGGLAAELLQRLAVGRYFLVELPDAVPLAYFYLRACFDCPIQTLYRPGDTVDPQARIVILAPWKLPDLVNDVDLLVNTMSFQHMMPESVDYYLGNAYRLKTKYLYLVNRDEQRDPTDPIISCYPVPGLYQRAYSSRWLFGRHIEVVFRRDNREEPT